MKVPGLRQGHRERSVDQSMPARIKTRPMASLGYWCLLLCLGLASCTSMPPWEDSRSQPPLAEPSGHSASREQDHEAERHLLTALEKAEGLGDDSPFVTIALYNLASYYQDRGQYAKAEPLYRRALAIKEERLGPHHPDVAVALKKYASLLRESGRPSEADELEARANAIQGN